MAAASASLARFSSGPVELGTGPAISLRSRWRSAMYLAIAASNCAIAAASSTTTAGFCAAGPEAPTLTGCETAIATRSTQPVNLMCHLLARSAPLSETTPHETPLRHAYGAHAPVRGTLRDDCRGRPARQRRPRRSILRQQVLDRAATRMEGTTI